MAPILQLENYTKSFGELLLLSNISFTINSDQRVGLIARNGAGKTTLLRTIAGLDSPDSGNIVWQKDIKVGYLDQSPVLNQTLSILENVFKGHDEASIAINRYEKALESNDKKELEIASGLMDSLNAWELEIQARQILTQLKITDLSQNIATLSGGQQKRVALASTLISRPDFLILDEPTNHLDLEMVEWLEEFLATNHISMLMVTHDRSFLDRVCTDIMEIDDKQIFWYKGNYSYFLEKREQRIEARNANIEKSTNSFRRELEWMRRTPSARTGKAKYRIDAFYTIRDEASKRFNNDDVRINVGAARLGKKVLETIDLCKKFDNIKILDKFSYNFRRFERLGIVGKNGTGKTTFLNLITGNIKADSGTIDTGETVVFGYYKQTGMTFDENMKVIDAVREIAEVVKLGDGNSLTVSQFLNMFLFPPNVQNSYIHKLSGGEKRRLYLCTILMTSPNFLILDEPTNDLDIQTLQVLEEYLESFPGVVLVVSHDRRFLDKVVDGLLIFDGNADISGFPGNYSEYHTWVKEQQKVDAEALKLKSDNRIKTKTAVGKTTKMSFAEKRELEALTIEIETLEQTKIDLENEVNSGLSDYVLLEEKSKNIGEIIEILDIKGERWLELMEKSESQ
ncbi:MAG: ABC-F family ATP-binding cassette domain-containing protein [Salinivirgaceae bacterium]|nr:ABC-F family ATP-binding cassette domain-containing protein [Salinivirgaceae bacterium]MDD4746043.1 ABC-F family ATP-binding cassette domain-containing protein [Salinivirgaceae bacterium]MDY0279315.1 ABC-F family ATP-binding cassette domain-containing protein [Salinivirgaceae bacterium]